MVINAKRATRALLLCLVAGTGLPENQSILFPLLALSQRSKWLDMNVLKLGCMEGTDCSAIGINFSSCSHNKKGRQGDLFS
jgi:hypothetical protein